MFCKYCGNPTEGDSQICDTCASIAGSIVDESGLSESEVDLISESEAKGSPPPEDGAKLKVPKPLLVAVGVVIVIVLAIIIGYFATRCGHTGCYNYASCGDYCEEHVCAMYPSCTSERASDSAYCYYHKGMLEELTSKSKNISVSDVRMQREKYSSYVNVTGTVKNNGTVTFDFVRVKAAFKNSAGSVVDTDWTYAVGSEGLAPGESTTFELYVKDSGSISTVDVTVIDD